MREGKGPGGRQAGKEPGRQGGSQGGRHGGREAAKERERAREGDAMERAARAFSRFGGSDQWRGRKERKQKRVTLS